MHAADGHPMGAGATMSVDLALTAKGWRGVVLDAPNLHAAGGVMETRATMMTEARAATTATSMVTNPALLASGGAASEAVSHVGGGSGVVWPQEGRMHRPRLQEGRIRRRQPKEWWGL